MKTSKLFLHRSLTFPKAWFLVVVTWPLSRLPRLLPALVGIGLYPWSQVWIVFFLTNRYGAKHSSGARKLRFQRKFLSGGQNLAIASFRFMFELVIPNSWDTHVFILNKLFKNARDARLHTSFTLNPDAYITPLQVRRRVLRTFSGDD